MQTTFIGTRCRACTYSAVTIQLSLLVFLKPDRIEDTQTFSGKRS